MKTMENLNSGLFIAVEGIDGSGTTTLINNLKPQLEKLGYEVLTTCEPSNSAVGSFIRQVLKKDDDLGKSDALGLLFAADRIMHYRQEIKPALKAGKIVITDRYLLSSLAYQTLEEEEEWIYALNSRVPFPQLTVFIDLDTDTAQKRMGEREQRDFLEKLEYQKVIRKNYHYFLEKYFPAAFIVDGTKSPQQIVGEVLEEIISFQI